ncbi:xylose isomerase [Radicibacter daui]|uniref:xylose isomerase n=1 Tax=Radicibacter daui TaxID=3064829 RepID=UPI00404699AF
MTTLFDAFAPVPFEGPASKNPHAFRFYDKNRKVMGKTLEEHLRFAVCYWHSFCWDGSDMFGPGTLGRSWQQPGDDMARAREKMDSAFAFMSRLGAPFWTFHDVDISPGINDLKALARNLEAMVDYAGRKMEETGIRLLWGTANVFSHPRYMAGASTNPDPEVFACAAAQVEGAMAATQKLGGENYVLWGGREGYDTLLNTDMKREAEQFGRFLTMVVEHKHKIGFKGTILIEPKPMEPTKHQYDYDVATVYGFLQRFGLEKEVKANIEVNHATLAGHSFQHELAVAASLGILGSVDANRGDYQNGWDTDQFPNSVEEMTLACYEILRAGGLGTGGFNFDTKVRRQSIDAADLFHAHIGAMDVMALSLIKAAALIESGELPGIVEARYAGWNGAFGQKALSGKLTLAEAAAHGREASATVKPVSGRQEHLENIVNRAIYSVG